MVTWKRHLPAVLTSAPPSGRLFPTTKGTAVVVVLFWACMIAIAFVQAGMAGIIALMPNLVLTATSLVLAWYCGRGAGSMAQLRYFALLYLLTSTAATLMLLQPAIREWYGAVFVNDVVLTALAVFVVATHLTALEFLALSLWNFVLAGSVMLVSEVSGPADLVLLVFLALTPVLLGMLSIVDRQRKAFQYLARQASKDVREISRHLGTQTVADGLALSGLSVPLQELLRKASESELPLPTTMQSEASALAEQLRVVLAGRMALTWLPAALEKAGCNVMVADPKQCLEHFPEDRRESLVRACLLVGAAAPECQRAWLWADMGETLRGRPGVVHLVWRVPAVGRRALETQAWRAIDALGRNGLQQDKAGISISLQVDLPAGSLNGVGA